MSTTMSLSVIILAAGKGTRMKSDTPKVLHKLANKPLLEHVYDTARSLQADEVIIVYGHEGEQVKQSCSHFEATWVEQSQQLGTGHAVIQALSHANLDNKLLVLYGDVPLISTTTLHELLEDTDNKIGLLTVELDSPFGYGRILRNVHNQVEGIVEQKDANQAQLKINEVNTGILCAEGKMLDSLLKQINNQNSQGEYYLTDIFALAAQQNIEIQTTMAASSTEVEGVNNRQQLAELERVYQQQMADQLMLAGVTLADPARLDIRGDVNIASDVFIDVNVILQGNVSIGKGCSIGANTVIKNSSLAENISVHENCVIDNAHIGPACEIGPFARIRPDTQLAESVKVGNFVEIKKANIDQGSKINHLSYIGDTDMGKNVNVGAGAITCNYDGANKHKTIIKDNVFVGSDSQLIAPLCIQQDVTIGAGSTVSKDVEENVLVTSRSPQKVIKGWKRPLKKK